MSRFVDIETLKAEGHSILDAQQLYADLGLDQFGQAFENTVKPDAFQNFGFDQQAASLAQTSYVAGRQTHLNGVEPGGDRDDPNSVGSKRQRSFEVYSQTALVTQQISITMANLTSSLENLIGQRTLLTQEQQQIVEEQAALQSEMAVTDEMEATAEAGIEQGNAAYEAAEAARLQAEEDLCSLPEGGIEGITLDALLDPDSSLNQSFAEDTAALQEAEIASMAAQRQMYGAAQMQMQAAIREQREAAEAARLEERQIEIQQEITELTEEIELTQTQIARLEDPETIAAIERGDISVEDAVSSVSRNVEFNGSTLTTAAAADVDGQGVVVETDVSLSASYNDATGLRPDNTALETGSELTQADLVMRQAQEAAARNSFTPT